VEIAWTIVGVLAPLLLGAMLTLVGLTPPEFRAARICLILSATILGGMQMVWQIQTGQPLWWRLVLGFVIFGLIGAGLPEGLRWISKRENRASKQPAGAAPSKAEEKPPTLADLFKSDFPNVMKFTGDRFGIQWKNGSVSPVVVQNYLDFPAKSQFVGFYVASSTRTFDICMKLADDAQAAIEDMRTRVKVGAGDVGGVNTIDDLTFSGRVFIYHEDFLTNPQKARIILAFTEHRYDVQLRGQDYLGPQVVAWHHAHDAKAAQK